MSLLTHRGNFVVTVFITPKDVYRDVKSWANPTVSNRSDPGRCWNKGPTSLSGVGDTCQGRFPWNCAYLCSGSSSGKSEPGGKQNRSCVNWQTQRPDHSEPGQQLSRNRHRHRQQICAMEGQTADTGTQPVSGIHTPVPTHARTRAVPTAFSSRLFIYLVTCSS